MISSLSAGSVVFSHAVDASGGQEFGITCYLGVDSINPVLGVVTNQTSLGISGWQYTDGSPSAAPVPGQSFFFAAPGVSELTPHAGSPAFTGFQSGFTS